MVVIRVGAVALMLAACGGAAAGEVPAAFATASRTSDPCSFYRDRAHGSGIDHFATEVVWACEAVARRRGTGMPMSDRMLAVEFALERYRAALVEWNRSRLAHPSGPGAHHVEARERAQAALAEESGMLAALEAIRAGF